MAMDFLQGGPATMPGAVPGLPQALPDMGVAPPAALGGGPAMAGAGGLPLPPTVPGGMAAGPGGSMGALPPLPTEGLPAAGGPPPGMPAPPVGMGTTDQFQQRYEGVEQDDGSVVLYVKLPDGALGRAVKILPPLKKK